MSDLTAAITGHPPCVAAWRLLIPYPVPVTRNCLAHAAGLRQSSTNLAPAFKLCEGLTLPHTHHQQQHGFYAGAMHLQGSFNLYGSALADVAHRRHLLWLPAVRAALDRQRLPVKHHLFGGCVGEGRGGNYKSPTLKLGSSWTPLEFMAPTSAEAVTAQSSGPPKPAAHTPLPTPQSSGPPKPAAHTPREPYLNGADTPSFEDELCLADLKVGDFDFESAVWRCSGRALGAGGFATVYEAVYLPSGLKVAVKVLTTTNRTPEEIDMIATEILALRRVQSPHVARLYNVFRDDQRVFLVMELCSGGSLSDYIAAQPNGRLSESQAARVFRQLLSAVHASHQCGVLHRDLKPENVLLDSKGNVKLADFGLAELYDAATKEEPTLHCYCGTEAFMAPEMIDGGAYTPRALDVYGLGMVLFVCLAGHLPFDAETPADLRREIHGGRLRVPRGLSAHAVRLLRGLLVTNPAMRIDFRGIWRHAWVRGGHSSAQSD